MEGNFNLVVGKFGELLYGVRPMQLSSGVA